MTTYFDNFFLPFVGIKIVFSREKIRQIEVGSAECKQTFTSIYLI